MEKLSQDLVAMPLDMDLNSIDTSRPHIRNGELADLIIAKLEKKPTADNQGQILAIELKTASPTKSIKDEDLAPGVTVFHNINLVPTGKATVAIVANNIAEFAQSAKFQGSLGDFINGGYASLQGGSCKARIGYTPDGPDKKGILRRAKNEILSFVK